MGLFCFVLAQIQLRLSCGGPDGGNSNLQEVGVPSTAPMIGRIGDPAHPAVASATGTSGSVSIPSVIPSGGYSW